MARPSTQDRTQRPARRAKKGGGGLWFFLALLIAAGGAAFYFKPQILEFIGHQQQPDDLGDAPTRTAEGDEESDSRRQDSLPPRGTGVDRDSLAEDRADLATPDRDTDTAAPPPSRAGADDAAARELLARADEAYRAFAWDEARSLARQIASLNTSSEISVAAEDLLRGADTLEQVFERLGDDDELERNLETHPMLVSITYRGNEKHMLPILDRTSQQVPDVDDPVAWVRSRIRNGQEVLVLDTRNIFTAIPAADIIDVAPADLEPLIREKEREFAARRARLEGSELADDPLAWYEAAKFAYRNRLDAQVTAMLDRALELDPTLATTIREDKARDLYFKMMTTMESGNKAAAAGWKVKLDDHYADTSIYPEAVAFYLGEVEALAEARREAAETRRRQREEALAARRERAEELGDQEQLAEVERQAATGDVMSPDDEEPSAPVASGDRAAADQVYNEGLRIYSQAQSLGVTEERDQLYAQAEVKFRQAMDLYLALGDEAMVSQANQYRYACIKYRRF